MLGILVARWAPHPMVAPLAVLATLFIQGKLSESEARPFRWMAFSADGVGLDDGIAFPGPVDWHVLFLLGTVAITGGLALGRHGFSRPVTTFLVGAVAVSRGGRLRPDPPPLRLRRPAAGGRPDRSGADVRGAGRGALLRRAGLRGPLGQWDPPVQAVLARVPAAVRDRGLVVSMRELNVVGTRLLAHAPFGDGVGPVAGTGRAGAGVAGRQRRPPLALLALGPGLQLHRPRHRAHRPGRLVGRHLPPPRRRHRRAWRRARPRSVLALWLAGQSTAGRPGPWRRCSARARGWEAFTRSGSTRTTRPNWGVSFAHGDIVTALALLKLPPTTSVGSSSSTGTD